MRRVKGNQNGSRRVTTRRSGLSSLDASLRSRPRGPASVSSSILPGGFPDRYRCTLRYAARFSLTTTVSAQQQVFVGNDVFDPDFTGTGSQPSGYDSIAPQYGHWKVHGSRCRVTAVTTSASTPCIVSFGARQGTGTGFVVDDASRPRHVVKFVNSGVSNTSWDMSYTTQEILGLTPAQYQGEEDIAGIPSAGPSHEWYWAIRQSSFDDSTSCVGYYFAMIDYDVEFYDRADPTLSLTKAVMERKEEKKTVTSGLRSAPLEDFEFVEIRRQLKPVDSARAATPLGSLKGGAKS